MPIWCSRCRTPGSTSTTLDDLDAAAARVPGPRTGSGCASPPSTTAWCATTCAKHGVADYQLVDSQGATEGTVKNETAEAIADITSTGDTLRANHLKVLAGGPVHRSQATLFKSRKAPWTNDERATFMELCRMLGIESG